MGRPTRTQFWLIIALLAQSAVGCGNERQPRSTPDSQRAARAATLTVPAGTTFEIRTHTALSTERNRPGDVLTASLVGPLVDAAGNVIVPADAVVRARVTVVARPVQADQAAVLGLAFEAISVTGDSYPFQATIEEVMGRTDITALRAAAAGHADGTPIAIESHEVDAILPRGLEMRVRVSEPLTIMPRAAGAP